MRMMLKYRKEDGNIDKWSGDGHWYLFSEDKVYILTDRDNLPMWDLYAVLSQVNKDEFYYPSKETPTHLEYDSYMGAG
jgi:hypothetical protein